MTWKVGEVIREKASNAEYIITGERGAYFLVGAQWLKKEEVYQAFELKDKQEQR